jgi:hypothetical protein
MKPVDTSNSTIPSNSSHPRQYSSELKSPTPSPKRQKNFRLILILLGCALIITVYILAHTSISTNQMTSVNEASGFDQKLEIEVLDGVGNLKAAQHMTNILRSLGYDVVEMKKNAGGIVEHTYILDRSGNLAGAKTMAANLGVSPEKVFQKIDRTLYLDVTIIVGKDYLQLKPIQSAMERKIF